jgi:putative transposase
VPVSRRTTGRWVVARREGGFSALVPSPRQCPPRAGKQTEELAAGLKMENPARTGAQVHRILAAQLGWAPSVRTIQRWLEARELTTRPGGEPPEAFGRFQADQVNEIWTADLMNGPKVAGRPSFLAGIIDDQSRFLTGARFEIIRQQFLAEVEVPYRLERASRVRTGREHHAELHRDRTLKSHLATPVLRMTTT